MEISIPLRSQPAKMQQNLQKGISFLEAARSLGPEFLKVYADLLANVTDFINVLTPNSQNSSIPPSHDPSSSRKPDSSADQPGIQSGQSDANKPQTSKTENQADKKKRKPGGQPGHPGHTLERCEEVDEVIRIHFKEGELPPGNWRLVGHETRQVVEVRVSKHVVDYVADILENESGERLIAPFPSGVNGPVQYGCYVRSLVTYLSVQQVIPYARLSELLKDVFGISVSEGTINRILKQAYELLEPWEQETKEKLKQSDVIQHDTTGCRVGQENYNIHTTCNDDTTLLTVHKDKGHKGIDEDGVLPECEGTLVTDFSTTYDKYTCEHAYCHAHLNRDLKGIIDKNRGYRFPENFLKFFSDLHALIQEKGLLSDVDFKKATTHYRQLLTRAENEVKQWYKNNPEQAKLEKSSKETNLLERMRKCEDGIMEFAKSNVPYTNNNSEQSIRMTKVKMNISNEFRSEDGAKFFTRSKGYIETAKKCGDNIFNSIISLFNGTASFGY